MNFSIERKKHGKTSPDFSMPSSLHPFSVAYALCLYSALFCLISATDSLPALIISYSYKISFSALFQSFCRISDKGTQVFNLLQISLFDFSRGTAPQISDTAWKLISIISASSIWVLSRFFLNSAILRPIFFIASVVWQSYEKVISYEKIISEGK